MIIFISDLPSKSWIVDIYTDYDILCKTGFSEPRVINVNEHSRVNTDNVHESVITHSGITISGVLLKLSFYEFYRLPNKNHTGFLTCYVSSRIFEIICFSCLFYSFAAIEEIIELVIHMSVCLRTNLLSKTYCWLLSLPDWKFFNFSVLTFSMLVSVQVAQALLYILEISWDSYGQLF